MQEIKKEYNSINISKEFLVTFFLFIVYKLLLDYVYKDFIVGIYGYYGFKYTFNLLKYMEVWVYCIILFLATSRNEQRVSDVFLNIQLLIMIMPMLTMFSFMKLSRIFIVTICFCHLLQRLLFVNAPKPTRLYISGMSNAIRIVIPLIVLLLIFISIIKNGVPSLSVLNISNVYSVRESVALPFGFGYFLGWACKILIPFCIVYYWSKNKKIISILYAVAQLCLYLIYAQKTFLFIIPVIFVIVYLLKKKMLIKGIYLGLIFGILASLVLYKVNKSFMVIPSMFIRRFLFIPAFLKNMYYNFYSLGKKNWFAYGTLGKLLGVTPNYEYQPSTMVATFVNGEFREGANTGYLGEAYAQGGLIMIIIMSIVLVIMIRLIEKCSVNLDSKLVVSSSMYVFLTLNDTALLTTILTGGLFVYIILIYAFNSDWLNRNINNNQLSTVKIGDSQ